MPGGDREDLAPRFEHRALPGRRDPRRGDAVRHVRGARDQGGQIGHDVDLHLRDPLGGQLHAKEPAPGLEDQIRRPDGGERDVEVGEGGHLPLRAGRQVVGPDVVPLGRPAIGEEIQPVVVPHRLGVVGRAAGDVLGVQRLEIEEPDLGRGPAPVALPRAEPAGLRGVGDAPPVGRQRAELPVRHGKPLGLTALDRDAVDLPKGGQAAPPVGGEEDPPAVRRPVEDPVVARMVRDAERRAAQGRDDVDVGVAVVVAAEGDLRAVGREPRKGFLPGRRAQLAGRAALLGDHPDVAGVDEGDLRLRDVGITQHPSVDLGPDRRRAQRDQQRQRSGEVAHLFPQDVGPRAPHSRSCSVPATTWTFGRPASFIT